MEEPILSKARYGDEVYRFLWLRTFDNPISIRIEKKEDNYLLIWKLCNGFGGSHPGKLIINEIKAINQEKWNKFKEKLNKTNFWELKTNEPDIINIITPDGSHWILEGLNKEKYHIVDRKNPISGSFYECCNFLIDLTNLKI